MVSTKSVRCSILSLWFSFVLAYPTLSICLFLTVDGIFKISRKFLLYLSCHLTHTKCEIIIVILSKAPIEKFREITLLFPWKVRGLGLKIFSKTILSIHLCSCSFRQVRFGHLMWGIELCLLSRPYTLPACLIWQIYWTTLLSSIMCSCNSRWI
jgi:hypothetical protein